MSSNVSIAVKMWYILVAALLPGVLGLVPDNCVSVLGSETEFECSYGDNVISVSGINDYARVDCGGYNFTCPELPRLNLAKGLPLKSLGVRECQTELLRCIDGVLNATSISHVTLTSMTSPLLEEDLKRFHDVKMLMLEQAHQQKSMPIAAINSLAKLEDLRIAGGDFQLSAHMFNNSPAIKLLELRSNNIRSISENTFIGLQNLMELNILRNNFEKINRGVLNGLQNLRALALNSNNLKYIEPGTFTSTPNLTTLQLNDNEMTSLPFNLLQGLNQLVNITILLNRVNLKLDEFSLSYIDSLKNVELINNGIETLPANLFHNSMNIQILVMSKNNIAILPSTVFAKLTKLKHIDLSFNKIRQLPEDVFVGLYNLEYLNLDRNYLESLPENLFSTQNNLKELYMDHNFIATIAWTCFQGASNLDTLSLAYNKLTLESDLQKYITEFEPNSPFQHIRELKKLNLSGNMIRTIFNDWRMILIRMEFLDLSWNHFSEVDDQQIDFLGSTITVDLRHNNISHVALSPFIKENPGSKTTLNKYLLLDDNPIICDCFLYGVKLRSKFTPNGEIKLVLDKAKCVSPPDLHGRLIEQVSIDDLLCNIIDDCPNNCDCNAKIATNEFLMDCKHLPRILPERDSVNFSYYFTKTPTFNVKLTNQPDSIDNYDIHTLNLTNSNIKDLIITPTESLKILDLSNNQLNTIPVDFIENKVTLYLSNNSFDCECWYTESIILLKKYDFVPDFYKITCNNGELISTIDVTALCNTMKAAITAICIFTVLTFLFLATISLIYRYKNEIMLYLSNICPAGCVEIIKKDSDKTYDVFISFAHQNFDFVDEILLPKLENEFNQKVCVHYRDWNVGELIPTQIIRSVEDSRKTIIVLSKGFLESVWANLEFSAAHNLALQERQSRVILILLNEEITKHEKISPELRAYINTNTYLVWGDPKFWPRLYKALPKLKHRFKFIEALKRKTDSEKPIETGLHVHLNSEGKLINCAAKIDENPPILHEID